MDRVTYQDAEVVELVSQRFIPVRIDRDRLPDVDALLQRSPALINPMGSAGGWPLTVVLTPEGDMLMKATFLPPHASSKYGAPIGLVELLNSVDSLWLERRQSVNKAVKQLREKTTQGFGEIYYRPGTPGQKHLDEIFAGLSSAYDPAHGGFGSAPKFYAHSALEFLLLRAWEGNEQAETMLTDTLRAIGAGGVHDQLGGGFHRYSVDERWGVPHFEKMAYDNAGLLANYANAYSLTGRDDFARIARTTFEWIDQVLTDPDRRGFYASQDADVDLNDDGDYFTWTKREIAQVLDGHQTELMGTYYGVDEVGEMDTRTGRNVLQVTKTPEQLSKLLDRDVQEIARATASAQAKLLGVRKKRPTPGVDKTIFADLNGMLIDAYLTLYERLGEEKAREIALDVLDNILHDLRDERSVFAHYSQDGSLYRIGLLADQAWMGKALLHAYQVTLDERYLRATATLGTYIMEHLTAEDGGFISAPTQGLHRPEAVTPMRSWDDSPSRSASSVAGQMLIDLGYLTGEKQYSEAAANALSSFAAGIEQRLATFFSGYGLSVDRLLNGPRIVLIVGTTGDSATQELLRTGRRSYIPGALVIAIDPNVPSQGQLLRRLGYTGGERPIAYVCRARTCLPPAHTPDQLKQRIGQLRSADSPKANMD